MQEDKSRKQTEHAFVIWELPSEVSGCVYNELGIAMVQGYNVAKKKNIRYAELQYFQKPILLKLQAMNDNFFSV